MKNSMNFGIEQCGVSIVINDSLVVYGSYEYCFRHPVYVLLWLGKISQRNEKIGRRRDRQKTVPHFILLLTLILYDSLEPTATINIMKIYEIFFFSPTTKISDRSFVTTIGHIITPRLKM